MFVNPTFLNPYTTTYIPMEKNTIAHGAPFTTVLVFTAGLRLAINKKNMAIIPAMMDTGMFKNSLIK
ncbi:Uncharacterised protein [Chlamydia trachomatis]|nr:Uncharacterised protein [Chlamydia trachomatis]